jgi:UPF0716 protein FxsA
MRSAVRRRVPWWVLALLFVVVPVVEIVVLIRIGSAIGAWWTVLLLVADGIIGSWLIKREGGRAWAALTAALQNGRMPARELADGALILVGGTLLLTPGFVSDVAGLFCVLPFTRPLARRALTRFLTRKLLGGPGLASAGAFVPGSGLPPFGAAPPGSGSTSAAGFGPGPAAGPGTPSAHGRARASGSRSPASDRARQSPGPSSVVRGEVVDGADER